MAAVRQGCTNIFSKATGGEIPSIKLRPGVALPHVTLPTTEVRGMALCAASSER